MAVNAPVPAAVGFSGLADLQDGDRSLMRQYGFVPHPLEYAGEYAADAAMQSAGCFLYDNCENIFVRRVMLFVNEICNPYAVRSRIGQAAVVA